MEIINSDTKRSKHDVGPILPDPVPELINLQRDLEPGDESHLVRLNRNERQQPLPQWFIETLRKSFHSGLLINYPVTDGIYRELSSWMQLPEEQLLLTAGSDAAIKALYQSYLRPGDRVLMLDPSYAMFEVYAQMFQATAHKVPFERGMKVDVEHLVASIVPGVRLVMVANPNQPTGTLMEEEILFKLAERSAQVGALLAVDESYFPFSQTTMLPWVKKIPHLLVIRSFSKAAGLAGLRVGIVAGDRDVIENLSKVRSVHDINSIAILCVSILIKHPEIVNDYIEEVVAGKQILTAKVRSLGLDPIPTHANFLLIRVAHRCNPSRLVDLVRDKGYLVKGPFSHPCLADCIRVTLGPPSLMETFGNVLEQALNECAEQMSA